MQNEVGANLHEDFDPEALARNCDNDPELARELCQLFLEQSKMLLNRLRGARDAGDSEALRSAAHSLKGAAASVGAERIRNLAFQIEVLGRRPITPEAESKIAELASALDVVEDAFGAVMRQH